MTYVTLFKDTAPFSEPQIALQSSDKRILTTKAGFLANAFSNILLETSEMDATCRIIMNLKREAKAILHCKNLTCFCTVTTYKSWKTNKTRDRQSSLVLFLGLNGRLGQERLSDVFSSG